jgi:hypothetical protein
MTPFRSALTNLSTLSVSGVAHNYDVDALPDSLARAQLPVLLVLPGTVQDSESLKERGKGFVALAFSSGARTITYAVTHLLLVAPVNAGIGSRTHLPKVIDLIDAYVAALAADVTLSGALLQPARIQVEPGRFPYGGVTYHGCAFHHTWMIQV